MQKIGHKHEVDGLNSPLEVKGILSATLGILDEEYGVERDIEADLGGYILVMEQAEDFVELERLNIDRETAFESAERICCADGSEYMQAVMMSSNDFAIIIVTPTKIAIDWLLEKLEG